MGVLITLEFVDNTKNIYQYKQEESFTTIEEAKEYLNENFEGNTRDKIYIDMKDGSAKHIGFVFKRWNHYYDTNKRYAEHVWVSIFAINRIENPVI